MIIRKGLFISTDADLEFFLININGSLPTLHSELIF